MVFLRPSPFSMTTIAWRHPGGVDVVDIAKAYDDTGDGWHYWLVVEGPAGWDPIPQPSSEQAA